MRFVLRSVPQMLVMAAVVTSALCVPIGALLAFLSFVLFGVSLRAFVTLGDRLTPFHGVLAWWALLFIPALVYAAYMMTWRPRE
jgi:predicted permease